MCQPGAWKETKQIYAPQAATQADVCTFSHVAQHSLLCVPLHDILTISVVLFLLCKQEIMSDINLRVAFLGCCS